MKKSATTGKQSSSSRFHQLLDSYALAAGAAGVSLLALAEPSAAEIVYTRAHHVIGDRSIYKLDLNHDGTIDLTIKNTYFHTCQTTFDCHTKETLAAKLAGTNQVVFNAYGAVAMKQGMRIGPSAPFHGGTQRMVTYGYLSIPSGSWINVNSRYLGIKFKIKGQTHYGWARLNVLVRGLSITATLTGYAYETTANKAILAGKTHGADVSEKHATLGELALGRK
jgi:hypothetical protein